MKSLLVLFSGAILFAIAAPVPAPMLAAGPMAQEAAPAPAAPASTNPVKPTAASQERAKKIYALDCALCHGDDGSGKTDLATGMQLTMPNWTDPKTLANRPDQELFHVIRFGKDKMPPESDTRAKDNEVWNLVLYIRSMSKEQHAETPKP